MDYSAFVAFEGRNSEPARRVDCDAVFTRELRYEHLDDTRRIGAGDSHDPKTGTICDGFRNDELQDDISVSFACSESHARRFQTILNGLRRGSSAIYEGIDEVDGLGTDAYVNGAKLNILDNDTRCVISIGVLAGVRDLEGEALVEYTLSFAEAITNQLTESALRSSNAWSMVGREQKPVSCGDVLDRKFRKRHFGKSARFENGHHYSKALGTQCGSIRTDADDRVRISFHCFDDEAVARRAVEMVNPFADDLGGFGRVSYASERSFAVLDDDTDCMVEFRVRTRDGELDGLTIAFDKAELVRDTLQRLDRLRIR